MLQLAAPAVAAAAEAAGGGQHENTPHAYPHMMNEPTAEGQQKRHLPWCTMNALTVEVEAIRTPIFALRGTHPKYYTSRRLR